MFDGKYDVFTGFCQGIKGKRRSSDEKSLDEIEETVPIRIAEDVDI